MKFKDISMRHNSRSVPGVASKQKIDTEELAGKTKEKKVKEDIPVAVPRMEEKVVIGKVSVKKKKKASKKKES